MDPQDKNWFSWHQNENLLVHKLISFYSFYFILEVSVAVPKIFLFLLISYLQRGVLSLCLRLSFFKMRQIDIHFCWKVLHQWQSLIKHRLHINGSIQWDTEIWGENGFEFNFWFEVQMSKSSRRLWSSMDAVIAEKGIRECLRLTLSIFSSLLSSLIVLHAVPHFVPLPISCAHRHKVFFPSRAFLFIFILEKCVRAGGCLEKSFSTLDFSRSCWHTSTRRGWGVKSFRWKLLYLERVCCTFFEKF